jgi:hypothetical protein
VFLKDVPSISRGHQKTGEGFGLPLLFPFFSCTQRGQAATKKDPACPGNYKLQITNYKHGASFGRI